MVGKVVHSTSPEESHIGDATCLLFYENHVISGGADGKIKIWNAQLQLVREIADAHESYIYTLAINRRTGRLYSCSADGTIRYFEYPLTNSTGHILMHTNYDEIIALFCSEADNCLWSGDDKGAVIKWVDDRIAFKYNLVEEVRSLYVENTLLYTARDLDAVVTDVGNSRTGQYVCIGTVAGRAPLTLCGPLRPHRTMQGAEIWRRQWLAFTTRDGRGLQLVCNARGFATHWVRPDAHEMIINALCGNERELFTAGYDGTVRRWTELSAGQPLAAGSTAIGHCVNAVCEGAEGAVYAADTRGVISRVAFSDVAA